MATIPMRRSDLRTSASISDGQLLVGEPQNAFYGNQFGNIFPCSSIGTDGHTPDLAPIIRERNDEVQVAQLLQAGRDRPMRSDGILECEEPLSDLPLFRDRRNSD